MSDTAIDPDLNRSRRPQSYHHCAKGDPWHAARLAGICEERGRILDLLDHYGSREYQGGWIRRFTEAIREGATAPREDPDQP